MTAPKRVQLRRTKGWRKPEGCIVVARPSRWGNPYVVGAEGVAWSGFIPCEGAGFYHPQGTDWRSVDQAELGRLTAAQAVRLYRDDLLGNLGAADEYYDELRAAIDCLRGHDLGCWCPLDQPCHADVLLELANRARPGGES